MSEENSHIKPIETLEISEKQWCIEAMVIRIGMTENFSSNNGSGKLRKLILIDNKGTKVQAVMFNDAVDKFLETFAKGNTYTIANGVVKSVNTKFSNVNEKIQLLLTRFSAVNESTTKIKTNILKYNFVSLKDLKNNKQNCGVIDVLGLVVHAQSMLTKFKDKKIMRKREIIIVDKSLEQIPLVLWDDLAETEGQIIENGITQKMVIALSNVQLSEYRGVLQLSTNDTTIIMLNPPIEEVNDLRDSIGSFLQKTKRSFLSNPTRIKNSEQVTLRQVIDNSCQEFECTFKAKILTILNKEDPWFYSCQNCNKKVLPCADKATCYNCEGKEVMCTPKYMLKLNISDGSDDAVVTIFDKAEILIGCSVKDYIKAMTEESKEKSVFYRKLVLCKNKEYYFLVRMTKAREQDRTRKQIIVEEIEQYVEDLTIENDQVDQSSPMRLKKRIKKEND